MAAEKVKPEDKNVSDRQKALDTALAQIERQFGKGSVMKMSDRQAQVIEVIPTGSIALDIALGIGGLPRGRIVEIYGPESSGKTTLTLHAIANAQKAGGICAFIDAEHAFDAEYAKKLGVDIDALLVSQPDTGEQALEIMDMLIRSGALDLVVVDSVQLLCLAQKLKARWGIPIWVFKHALCHKHFVRSLARCTNQRPLQSLSISCARRLVSSSVHLRRLQVERR